MSNLDIKISQKGVRKAYSSVTLVSAGSMVNAVLGFFFLTGVAKALPLSDFGKYALLTSLLTLISRIMDFGTNSVFVAAQNKIRGFLESKLILFLVAFPLSIITFKLLDLRDNGLFGIFILGLIAYGLNYTLYAYYQKEQKYLLIVLLNGLPAVVKAIYGFLLFFNLLSLNLHESFAVFSYSIFASLIIWAIFPQKTHLHDKAAFDLKTGWIFIKESLSPGISLLIYESWQTINNVLIKIFNTFSDVGIFSMANKISNIFSLISISVFTVLLPKNSERKNIHKAGYDFKETAILATAVLLSSFVLIFIAELFIEKVFGAKFAGSIKFLDLLIVAGAISAIQNFIENYFYVENATKFLVVVNLAKLFILLALSLILIPVYGLYSLAVINLVTALAGLLMAYLFIVKLEKAKINL